MKEGFSTITLVIQDDFKKDVKALAARSGRCTSNYVKWLLASAIAREKTNSLHIQERLHDHPDRPEDRRL